MPGRRKLYPPIEPFEAGRLRVSDIHEIYYEASGAINGKPVLVCHGGPGGGTTPSMRRYFNPRAYKIIMFDQRGCGRSTPHASLLDNTTFALVEDMEKLRRHLGVANWQLFGGSWGSTLALAYAQTYPERVAELVLRGVFTVRQSELDWFYRDGARWVFPEAWAAFVAPIPEDERDDLIAAYYRRLTGSDETVRLAAARAWSQWEGGAVNLLPSQERMRNFSSDRFAVAFARIESHYFVNRAFFERDDWLIANMHRIDHIPGVIAQGRYDMVTPVRTAFELRERWPACELIIAPDAGHAANEPGIVEALLGATDKFVDG